MKKTVVDQNVVHRMGMTAGVARAFAGKPVVSLRLPYVFPPETRIYFLELTAAGDPGPRADLCTVIGNDGEKLVLERRVCWHSAPPDAPVEWGKTLFEADYPLVTEAAL